LPGLFTSFCIESSSSDTGVIYRDGRLVTTAGVAESEGRFFLARRKPGGALSGKWEFPGGKCDQVEGSEAQCLIREFQEEFGVDIVVDGEIGSVPFEHGAVRYILVGDAIRFLQQPTQLIEHTESGWFDIDAMVRLDLASSDRRLVEAFLNR
jgi:8-oxo-dGTP diphosphatase